MNRFDSFSSFSEKVPCRSEWPYLRPVIFLEKVGGHLVSNFAISGNVSHYENALIWYEIWGFLEKIPIFSY